MTAEPFCELLTPTKTSPHRALKFEPLDLPYSPVAGVLTLTDKRTCERYLVSEAPAEVGRSFVLRKPGGRGFYCLGIKGGSGAEDTCECKRFEVAGPVCKHIESLRTLIKEGQL